MSGKDKATGSLLQAVRALQEQVRKDGFRSMTDEKAFMDEMCGEDGEPSSPEAPADPGKDDV